jgi:flagellar biosynthesis protein FliR
MEITFSYYPQTFLLVLARVLAIVGGAAIFGKGVVPPRIRVGLALVIALVFTPLVPPAWAQAASALNNLPELVFGMLGEVLLGAVISLICDLFMSVCLVAGQVAGFSSSLTMSEAIDPVNGFSNNILGTILQLTFFMLVLISNAHLLLLKLLFQSFVAVPPQLGWLSRDLLGSLVSLGTMVFEWGVRLAAPVLAGVLIIDAGFGLISRLAPDFNILFLSLPVRLLSGMALIGLTLRFGGGFFSRLMEQMLAYCARVLTG